MLIRNFLFRSSINYYLPMRRSPHSILWHHLTARRFRKFRSHSNNNNTNNNINNNNNIYDNNTLSNVKDYEYLSHNNHFYYFSSQQQQHQQHHITNDSGGDKCHSSSHITIDIDMKRNGSTTQNDSSISTLTNGGTKQQDDKQYQHHKQYSNDRMNSGTNTTEETNNNLSGWYSSTSNPQHSSVLCRVVLATVGVGILAAIVTLIWYYMGWTFGIPALLIALLVILLTKPGWRWFYIAGATTKRDLT